MTGPGRLGGRRHGGLLLTDLLVDHGVQVVFGLPGGQTMALYDGIAEREPVIRHVLVRDERTGGYAADAYARLTGRVGVCDATVGPGTAKLPSGLGEALNSSIPVLALVSELPAAAAPMRYRGAASQAIDQVGLLAPVTKWLATVERVEALPALVRRAFREATTGRPGPVALLLPQDVLDADVPAGLSRPEDGHGARYGVFPARRVPADPDDVAVAAGVLGAARRPFLLAGGGVLTSGAGAELTALAERLSAAVATTLSGKGAIGEDHPLAVGVVGTLGTTAAAAAFAEADVVGLFGTKSGGPTTAGWTLPRPDQRVVQIDVDPAELGKHAGAPADLLADARLGLAALVAAVDGGGGAERTEWRHRVEALRSAWREQRDRERADPGVPIAPQRVLAELEAVLGPADVVVCDASLASGWGGAYLEQTRPGRRMLFPRGLAGLGYALPAAIGAAHAAAGGRVVALAGDGAFAYAVGELATVREQRLPVVSVVLNNSSLGWLRWYQRITFGRGHEREDFADVDYAAVARAFGLPAWRVEQPTDLPEALAAALAVDGPALVDVRTETWQTPIAAHRRALAEGAAAGYGG